MSENRSIYASPITWAIILILIIVLGITISSLFTFSDDLRGIQRVQEESGTQQVSERRTVVALSNGQADLESDLEASDAAQQSAIDAVYSTQSAISDEAATQLAALEQMIDAISTDQAALAENLGAGAENVQATQAILNATFERGASDQQNSIAALQATQNALSQNGSTREAVLAETIAAINAEQTSVSEWQATQSAFLNNAGTREAALHETITVMQSTQVELAISDTPTATPSHTITPTPTATLPQTATYTPSATVTPVAAALYINDVTALRAGPGTEFERLAWLRQSEKGYSILMVDQTAQYYQIDFDGQVGWVAMGARIQVEGDISQIPTAAPVAAVTPTATPTPGN